MKILSYDVESCTGNTHDGSLCSLGYVLTDENFNVIKKEDILINPLPKKFRLGRKGEEPHIKLSYTEEEFRQAPRFDLAYDKIASLFTEDTIVVGFAISNDLAYLNDACRHYRKKIINFKYFDVQQIMSFIHTDMKNAGLMAYAKQYGLEFIEHRSDEDAYATLLLYKCACEKLKITSKELINYYGIMLGVNTYENIERPVYTAEIFERHGLKRSRSMSNVLFFEFLEEIRKKPKIKGGVLNGKRICFNTNLETEDINYSRKLITEIYKKSGKYTADLTSANLFVYDDNLEDKRYKKARQLKKSENPRLVFISQNEFLSLLGEVEDTVFDDVKYLRRHEENRRKIRLKNEEEKRRVKREKQNNPKI